MEEELTLEEVWKTIREEIKPSNPPLSFTTKMFCEEFDISKTQAIRKLNELQGQGKVKRIDKYFQEDKNGRHHAVPGWQWILSDQSK